MKNLVLKIDGEYALIARVREDGTVHEYVVAWCYKKETDSWGQGHYFSDIVEAVCYFDKGLEQKLRLHKLIKVLTDPDVDEYEKEDEYDNFMRDYPFFNSSRLDVFFK